MDNPEISSSPSSDSLLSARSTRSLNEMAEEEFSTTDVVVEGLVDAAEGVVAGTTGKKRKESDCWRFFNRPSVDENGNLVVTCKYCTEPFSGDIANCETGGLNGHTIRCAQTPNELKPNTQKKLNFKPIESSSAGSSNVLGTWVFNQARSRDKLARMLVKDELPFRLVEGEGFRDWVQELQPMFKIPSRTTASRDVYEVFLDEQYVMKQIFRTSCPRISLTMDTWTSVQQINYMCLTAQYIDEQWVLHKKIINFCPVSSREGEDIGKAVEKCLHDWGISGILCVTVDNVSSNNSALAYLKKKFPTILSGKYMHMCCIAHIINLVVERGLKLLGRSVEKARVTVRFIKSSPSRIQKFKNCAIAENICTESLLALDVSTRWNSTYLMLQSVCKFESVFERYEIDDPYYAIEMETTVSEIDKKVLGCFNDDDWLTMKKFMSFLEHFYELILRVSGSKCTTSNIILDEISDTYIVLNDALESGDLIFSNMAIEMKEEYDKYWGDMSNCNLLIFVSRVFDPRHKLDFVKYAINIMFPLKGPSLCNDVEKSLYELFDYYSKLYPLDLGEPLSQPPNMVGGSGKPYRGVMAAAFKQFISSSQGSARSEMDRYLKEDLEQSESGFNILHWWKINSSRFPVVSRMARDVLAIPISTVSSESAFITGGRVLTDYRSSLSPRMVEALVCTQDWIRRSNPVSYEEHLKDMDCLEEDLAALMISKQKQWEALQPKK